MSADLPRLSPTATWGVDKPREQPVDDRSVIGAEGKEEDNNSTDGSRLEAKLAKRSQFAYPGNCCGEEVSPTNTMRTAAYPNVDEKI